MRRIREKKAGEGRGRSFRSLDNSNGLGGGRKVSHIPLSALFDDSRLSYYPLLAPPEPLHLLLNVLPIRSLPKQPYALLSRPNPRVLAVHP
jgi:hypothetical protein